MFDWWLLKIYSVVSFNEGVVDSDDFDVGVFDGVVENDMVNVIEVVDVDFDGSYCE